MALKNRSLYISNKIEIVRNLVVGKKVLDVGCVGQAVNYENSNWIHNVVKNTSKELLGVDINEEGIKVLNDLGYDVITPNELRERDLLFDVILMLDVIEHVENPLDLIEFYKDYLCETGQIVISTPNAHRSIDIIKIFISDSYGLNEDHVCWYCPRTLKALIDRSDGLTVDSFFWLGHAADVAPVRLKSKIIYFIDNLLFKMRKNFSPNFIMVIKKSKEISPIV